MKKIFSFFFLGVFLFNTSGYLLVYKITQYHLRNKMEADISAGVNLEALTLITTAPGDQKTLIPRESGKEILYQNQLFDVVKKVSENGVTKYYCINDKQEESLLASLNDHIDRNVAATTPLKNSKKLIHNIVKLYFSTSYAFEFNVMENDRIYHLIPEVSFHTAFENTSPPPEFS